MKEFSLLGIVTVLFVVTFVIAGLTGVFVAEWIRYIGCFACHPTAVNVSVIVTALAIVAFVIACVAWLVLWLGNMPRGFILPIWILTFASVVAYLAYAGEAIASDYATATLWIPITLLSESSPTPPSSIEAYVWIPITLLLTSYLYVLVRRHSK